MTNITLITAGVCCFHPCTRLPEHLLVLLFLQLCKRFWAGIMKGTHTTQIQEPNLARLSPYAPSPSMEKDGLLQRAIQSTSPSLC